MTAGRIKAELRNVINIIIANAIFILISILIIYLGVGNSLLFHTMIEFLSIIMALSIIIVAINTQQISHNDYFTFLGISLRFVAVFELLHILSYKGLGIFPELSANVSTQFWVITRLMLSITLAAAFTTLNKKVKTGVVNIIYFAISGILLLTVLYWGNFPVCYKEGVGLTSFENFSEYVVSAFFLLALVLLHFHRKRFSPCVYRLIFYSVTLSFAGEMFLTFNRSVFSFSNMVGHILELYSFYLIYKAIVETSLKKPYDSIFYELNKLNNELKEQKEFTEKIIQYSSLATFVLDPMHRVLVWNKACEKLSGVKADKLLGTTGHQSVFYDKERPCLADLIIDQKLDQLEKLYDKVNKSNLVFNGYSAEGWFNNVGGKRRYLICDVAPIYNSRGELVAVKEMLRDQTEKKLAENTINRLAFYDSLTELPNRMLFFDRLKLELIRSEREKQMLAIMFLDLDGFKNINDSLGHNLGDRMLVEVAKRLIAELRKSDTAARMGGDEFLLLLPKLESAQNAAAIAQKVIGAFEKTFEIDGHLLNISTSVGIALYPTDGTDAETLVRHADIAMYEAKEKGGYCFYHRKENNGLQ